MDRLFRRFEWRTLPITGRVGAMFLVQVMVVGLLGIVALAGQATIRRQLDTSLASSVHMRGLAQDLQIDVEALRNMETRLIEQQYGWNAFDVTRPHMASDHIALTEGVAQGADELVVLAGDFLDESELGPIATEVDLLKDSVAARQENFDHLLTLIDRVTAVDGEQDRLAEAGDALEELTRLQDDVELTSQLATVRNIEDGVSGTRSAIYIERLREALNVYLDIYWTRILPGERVTGIPSAVADYLDRAETLAETMAQIDATYVASSSTLEVTRTAVARLVTLTEADRAAQVQNISRVQRRVNRIATAGLMLAVVIGGYLSYRFGQDLAGGARDLLTFTRQFEAGDLSVRAPAGGQDEFSELGAGFNAMAERLEDLVNALERRVAERTRDLSITAEMGRAVTAGRNARDLMNEVVEMIRQRFGYHHAQVFLIDEARHTAQLMAATGAAGRQMLINHYTLPIDSQSAVGRAVLSGQPVVTSRLGTETGLEVEGLLPDAQAQMALPMRVGEHVVGTLDVQSVQSGVFDEDVVAVFQVMADQLAMALENARLQAALAEAETTIRAAERLRTRQGWQALRQARESGAPLGYELGAAGLVPQMGDGQDLLQRAAQGGRALVESNGEVRLTVPIRVRGEMVGAFAFSGENLRSLSDDDLALVEAVVDRVGLALENMRLMEQTARRAEHEQILNEITARLVGSTDVDEILQITVQEIGRVLQTPQTSVQLRREDV